MQVQDMDDIQKLSVYMHYYIVSISRKKDSFMGKKLWVNDYVYSFDEFKVHRQTDYGTHVYFYSLLSEWYSKFKNEIKLA